jgi:hypothetical protein
MYDVWMVDRGDGARLALKPAHIVSDQPLDRDRTIQAFIVRLVDLPHASRADQRLDRVWAEPRAGSQEHEVPADSIALGHPSLRRGLRPENDLSGIRTRPSMPTF